MSYCGDKVLIRAIDESDIPLINKWSNDSELWDMLGGWHFPYSMKNTIKWFESLDCNDCKNQIFALSDKKTNDLIGTINLSQIDWKNKNAIYGIMLGSIDKRGQGFGYDAVQIIMKYSFEELGLNRLDTDVIEYNKRSLDFHINKCGWLEEGRRTNWFYRKGQYWDKVLLGITHDRFKEFTNGSK